MKITYTSYRPIAYWKWETSVNAVLPPIPNRSESNSYISSLSSDDDSDSDPESLPTASTSKFTNPSRVPVSQSEKAKKRAARRAYQAKANGEKGSDEEGADDDEDDCCGICQEAFESACPGCKMPGDDCPLSEWG